MAMSKLVKRKLPATSSHDTSGNVSSAKRRKLDSQKTQKARARLAPNKAPSQAQRDLQNVTDLDEAGEEAVQANDNDDSQIEVDVDPLPQSSGGRTQSQNFTPPPASNSPTVSGNTFEVSNGTGTDDQDPGHSYGNPRYLHERDNPTEDTICPILSGDERTHPRGPASPDFEQHQTQRATTRSKGKGKARQSQPREKTPATNVPLPKSGSKRTREADDSEPVSSKRPRRRPARYLDPDDTNQAASASTTRNGLENIEQVPENNHHLPESSNHAPHEQRPATLSPIPAVIPVNNHNEAESQSLRSPTPAAERNLEKQIRMESRALRRKNTDLELNLAKLQQEHSELKQMLNAAITQLNRQVDQETTITNQRATIEHQRKEIEDLKAIFAGAANAYRYRYGSLPL